MSTEFTHRSVLLDECIDALAIKPDGIYLEKGYEAPVLKLKVKEKATEEEAGDSQTG